MRAPAAGVTRAGCAFLLALVLAGMAMPARAEYDQTRNLNGTEQAIQDYALSVHRAMASLPITEVQTEAPASSGASPVLLDRAHLPALIGLALGQPVAGGTSTQSLTLSLDAFAVAAAWDSALMVNPDRYASASSLRRLGGTLTLGAPVPSADSIQATSRATDHIVGSLKLRLLGSRDRRDYPNRYRAVSTDAPAEILGRLTTSSTYTQMIRQDASERGKYQATMAALRANPALAAELLGTLDAATRQIGAINDSIDRSLVVSLELTADAFAGDLGRDKYGATLIAEMGQPFDLTFNAGYSTEEEIDGLRRDELRMALGANGRLLGRDGLGGPMTWTVAGSGLVRNDHRTSVWSLNTKLDFPLDASFKLEASVTWANHPENIGEAVVRGNFGISYQLLPVE